MKTIIRTLVLLLVLIYLTPANVAGQVSISLDSSPPDPSAMLDVKSTTKGMLIPRMTSMQRDLIVNPATGLLVFDDTTVSFWFYNGMAWTELVEEPPVPNKIADADNDTRVEVEQLPDEDKIRFTVAGTEYFRMEPGRLQVSNTG